MREQEIKKHVVKLEKKLLKNETELEDFIEENEDFESDIMEIYKTVQDMSIDYFTALNGKREMQRIRSKINSNKDKIETRKRTIRNVKEDLENSNKWEVTK